MGLYIDNTLNKGRGVFTDSSIKKNTLIEISPCIKIEHSQIKNTILNDYCFGSKTKDYTLICFGYASMYNHSNEPNISVVNYDEEKIMITFKSIRDIEKGEELCHDYGYKKENWI
jgi:hypothetical protein